MFPSQDGQVHLAQVSAKNYPPDNEAVPVERCWQGKVRDLERKGQDQGPLFGGEGWTRDQPELVCL